MQVCGVDELLNVQPLETIALSTLVSSNGKARDLLV